MKNVFALCLTIILLSFGVHAQEDQFTDEFQENGTEVALMVLEKESNLPVCRLSDQVKINAEFIPEGRIDNIETASIQDVRICQEEDVWNAVEEEMLVGMAIGPLNFSPVLPMISGGAIGCFLGYLIQWDEATDGPYIPSLVTRLIGNGFIGAIFGLIGADMQNREALTVLKKTMPNSLLVHGLAAGAFSAIIAGEACRNYQWGSE